MDFFSMVLSYFNKFFSAQCLLVYWNACSHAMLLQEHACHPGWY